MSTDTERQRQQEMLRAVFSKEAASDLAALQSLVQEPEADFAQSLAAYRANGWGSAERALSAMCPTVQQMMGDIDFRALARSFWVACPPERGDLARWGDKFPAFIEHSPSLQSWPYLADVARVDAACQAAEAASDAEFDATSFQKLADEAEHLDALHFRLAPGLALVESAYPVASLWLAHHHPDDPERERCMAQADAKLQSGQGEAALIWRRGWRGECVAADVETLVWWRELLAGQSLDAALSQAVADFSFEAWLQIALSHGWILGVMDLQEGCR